MPRNSKGLTCMIFIGKPINPESTPPLSPISGSHIQGHYFPVLITQRPGTKQLGTVFMLQSLLKLFKPANPNPAYPASTIPSHGNHNKGSGSSFPHLLLPPDQHPAPTHPPHNPNPTVTLQGPLFSLSKHQYQCFLMWTKNTALVPHTEWGPTVTS